MMKLALNQTIGKVLRSSVSIVTCYRHIPVTAFVTVMLLRCVTQKHVTDTH